MRSAFTSSSRPVSIASTRRSRENQWRILVRARGVCANCSQSRLGPAPSTLLVKISTVSPDDQRRVERDEPTVDPGPDAPVPDLGVDRVGEVHRVGAGRHRHDLALRREDEDLVLLEVDLQGLHELGRVLGLLLPVHEPLEPDEVVGLVGLVALLVAPVRGDAVLGAPVHLVGADLHLDEPAARDR